MQEQFSSFLPAMLKEYILMRSLYLGRQVDWLLNKTE